MSFSHFRPASLSEFEDICIVSSLTQVEIPSHQFNEDFLPNCWQILKPGASKNPQQF